MTTERPWGTDGGTVAAYKKKDGRLKELGRAVVTRGAGFVRLPWKKAPFGRTSVMVCYLGSDVVEESCSPYVVVQPRRLAAPNQPGAAATNASRSSAPAPSGITASSGAIRCRSSRLHRSASPGSAGQAPMTRPRTGEAAGAERVDRQLGVVEGAEPGRDHDDHLDLGHGVQEGARSSRVPPAASSRTSSPPAPSTMTVSCVSSAIRAAYDATAGRSTPGAVRRCRGRAARRAWSTPRPRRR